MTKTEKDWQIIPLTFAQALRMAGLTPLPEIEAEAEAENDKLNQPGNPEAKNQKETP